MANEQDIWLFPKALVLLKNRPKALSRLNFHLLLAVADCYQE